MTWYLIKHEENFFVEGVPGSLPPGIKRPGREADHSPPSSAEFKNSPSMSSWRLVQHRGKYILFLSYLYIREQNDGFGDFVFGFPFDGDK
jgi:hypothetical protein